MQKNSIIVNGKEVTGRTISFDEEGLKVDGKLIEANVAKTDKKNKFVNEYDVNTEDVKVAFDTEEDGLASSFELDDTSEWDDEDFDDDFDDDFEDREIDFDEEYRKYKRKKRIKAACIIGGVCAVVGSAVTAALIFSKKNK